MLHKVKGYSFSESEASPGTTYRGSEVKDCFPIGDDVVFEKTHSRERKTKVAPSFIILSLVKEARTLQSATKEATKDGSSYNYFIIARQIIVIGSLFS